MVVVVLRDEVPHVDDTHRAPEPRMDRARCEPTLGPALESRDEPRSLVAKRAKDLLGPPRVVVGLPGPAVLQVGARRTAAPLS
jgi:hypothetical protein